MTNQQEKSELITEKGRKKHTYFSMLVKTP